MRLRVSLRAGTGFTVFQEFLLRLNVAAAMRFSINLHFEPRSYLAIIPITTVDTNIPGNWIKREALLLAEWVILA